MKTANQAGISPNASVNDFPIAYAMLTLLFAMLVLQSVANAQTRSLEQGVKAAYLYQFGSYVDWPDEAFEQDDSPLVIAVAYAEGVARALEEAVRGRTVQGRRVEVQRVAGWEALDGVHILFAGGADARQWQELMDRVGPRPVLVVTNGFSGFPPDSAINFVVEDNRVRFDVNLSAARKQGVGISARLLSVARVVHGEAG